MLGLTVRAKSLDVALRYNQLLSSSSQVSRRAAITWDLKGADIRICPLLSVFDAHAVRMDPCGGISAGVLGGTSRGLTIEGSGSAGWIAGYLGLRVVPSKMAKRFAFELTLDGLAVVTPSAFEVGGIGLVHEPSTLAPRIGIGAMWEL